MNRHDLEDTLHALAIPACVLEVESGKRFRLTELNVALKHLFGTDADPRGRYATEFVFSRTAGDRSQALAERCFDSKQTISSEESFILRSGAIVHVRITMTPNVVDGEIESLFVTIDNVTDLVNLRMERARELTLVASDLVRMCGWCHSVESEHGWQAPEQFVEDLNVTRDAMLCPDCLSARQS